MSGPVDVLAMLKQAAQVAEHNGLRGDARDFERAHAVVAELLDAEREVRAAYAAFPKAGTATTAQLDEVAARLNAALRRRAAAFDQVQEVEP